MSKSRKLNKKQEKTKKKNDLPVFDSDAELLAAFLDETRCPAEEKTVPAKKNKGSRINKHGLPFIEEYDAQFIPEQDAGLHELKEAAAQGADPLEPEVEDFARLLDQSLKNKKIPRHIPKPMPLKRRIRRYPPPEADLDLHGFTAVGAELKAKSFITTAKIQGFFTLRIIVGRGLHSQEGAVLPHVVEDLLKAFKQQKIVLSYQWEGPKKNKSGSVLVYLKQFSD